MLVAVCANRVCWGCVPSFRAHGLWCRCRGEDAELLAALALLRRCLDPNPRTRITAGAALQHEFMLWGQ